MNIQDALLNNKIDQGAVAGEMKRVAALKARVSAQGARCKSGNDEFVPPTLGKEAADVLESMLKEKTLEALIAYEKFLSGNMAQLEHNLTNLIDLAANENLTPAMLEVL